MLISFASLKYEREEGRRGRGGGGGEGGGRREEREEGGEGRGRRGRRGEGERIRGGGEEIELRRDNKYQCLKYEPLFVSVSPLLPSISVFMISKSKILLEER